jgi:hypothetical protein
MFHEDVTTLGEEPEEIARPARIAVPMIDRSVNAEHNTTDGAEDPEYSDNNGPTDEVNIENETTEVTLDETVLAETIDTEEIALNVPKDKDDSLQADENVDTSVTTEGMMSEDWTYDEGEQSYGDVGAIAEPQVPETNPQHEAIRSDILALIDNYDTKKYPDAIRELLDYLETEDYLTLRDELRHLWSELLKHHQQEGSRIPHMATGAFTNLSKSLQVL